MAHFARLGLDNIVEEVVVVNNVDTMTPQGVETESIGIDYLKNYLDKVLHGFKHHIADPLEKILRERICI